MRRSLTTLLLTALALLLAPTAAARAQDAAAAAADLVTEARIETLATFGAARALAVDPAGRLYVADGARSVVVRMAPDGTVLDALGGAGTETGEFDGPADVDPTNGLALLVADAGNARIQRFSRNLLHLETLPVARGADALEAQPSRSAFDLGRADDFGGGGGRADGRPVAVVSTRADETLALDAASGTVIRWDVQRRPVAVVGDRGAGRLVEPVAMALDADERLFVADRAAGPNGTPALVVYDAFGTYLRTLPLPPNLDLGAVAVVPHPPSEDEPAGQRLWAIGAGRLVALTPEGRVVGGLRLDLGAPVVDAARHDGATYVLTRRRLMRVVR
jgi:hypothetical protein